MVSYFAALDGCWTYLDRPNPTWFRQTRFDGGFEPCVHGHRGNGIERRLDDQVRGTTELLGEVPHGFVGPLLGLRQIFRVALGRAAVHPSSDRVDLLIGK